MKNKRRFILWHIILATTGAALLLFLLYNALEIHCLNFTISLILSLSIVVLVFVQMIFVVSRIIHLLKERQFGIMLIYTLLFLSLILLARMGLWMVMIYSGGGAVGGH